MDMIIPVSRTIRIAFATVLMGAMACAVSWFIPRAADAAAADEKTQATPVLVELFTSEGCSDCPPADDLLAHLDREQYIRGVHAIVLSEHVTYWNHEGWRDPFSLDQVDYRQRDYQERFNLNSSYTPQMVVDGTEQFVGNNSQALARAMAAVAATPKQPLEIADAHWEKNAVQFSIKAISVPGSRLVAALAADATHSEVSRGENAGRTLHHVAVVRVMKEFKSDFADGRALSLPAADAERGNDGPLRLVVFLADNRTGHVVGVAEKNIEKQ